MPNTVTFKILGLKELQDKLEALPKKMSNKVLRVSLKKAAARIRDAMVRMAPRDSGFLAEHFGIRTKIKRADIAGAAYVGPQGKIDYPLDALGSYKERKTKEGKIRRIGRVAVATVARFLEFGTSKTSARPFMTTAFESSKQAALDELITGIKEELDAASK